MAHFDRPEMLRFDQARFDRLVPVQRSDPLGGTFTPTLGSMSDQPRVRCCGWAPAAGFTGTLHGQPPLGALPAAAACQQSVRLARAGQMWEDGKMEKVGIS